MWDGDLTGEVVDGRYALGSLYGSGGMAEVYRALDTRLDRKVAIKFFLGEGGEDRIRLDREAQVLAAMHCPGLVEVYGTGTFRGRPYFVMQPVDGGTLRRRMRGAMSPEVVAVIGSQVAGVLAHVHSHDVVHRDVKPSNILLDTTGRRAYLADFGLALQGQVTRVTRSGVLVGTAGYLAPEQVRGGDVRPSADVYALGLVLLECLTGRPEYPGGDTEAALSRLHREPRVPADLPGPWTDVLTAMTATDPTKRPSAAECERLLTRAQRASVGLPPLAEVVVADRPAAEPEGRRIGNRAVLAGALVAAGALALTGFLVWGGPPERGSEDHADPRTTSTVAEPVVEHAQTSDGVTVPDDRSGSPVTTGVQGTPKQGGTDVGGGDHGTTGAALTGTTQNGSTQDNSTAGRGQPTGLPTNGPAVVLPTQAEPGPVQPPTNPRSGSGKG